MSFSTGLAGIASRRTPFCLRAHERSTTTLYYALAFLLVAILAGILGFGAIAGTAGLIAKILFGVFLVLFVVTLVTHTRRRRQA